MKQVEFKSASGTRLKVNVSDKVYKKYKNLVDSGYDFAVDFKKAMNFHFIVFNTQKHDIVTDANSKMGNLTEVVEDLIKRVVQ